MRFVRCVKFQFLFERLETRKRIARLFRFRLSVRGLTMEIVLEENRARTEREQRKERDGENAARIRVVGVASRKRFEQFEFPGLFRH